MLRGSTHGCSSSSNSSPWSDHGVPAIFLSHSGKQKPFVENLFNALKRANHWAFFDKHTLPKGEKFPEHIKTAARGCEVGVVVLSEDFLMSKWPMLELEILVLQRGPKAKVLPLFYKLTPADLKNAENLSRWQQAWEKFGVADPDVLMEWQKALRTLRAFNGERFTHGTSESSYIDTVVRNLCKQVPSPLLEDLSPIKGLHRLAEEVAGIFDNSRQCDGKALLVGLHGVGGLGKTTICKIMVNFYNAEYRGRCHHLEFPTTYGEEVMPQIVQDCKNALKQLTNLSNELLNKANKFGEVIGLMKEHLRQFDVFLAIDNVYEDSSEAAKRILEVGFSANSKILLTSRSEQVLEDVLDAHSNVCVHRLPAINRDEAFQIFQDAFGKGSIDFVESCREEVDRIITKFLFDGDHHALAMKALGGYVRKGCKLGDSKEKKEFLSRVAEQVQKKDLKALEKVIRIRYDDLPEHKKSMFLDIAVTLPMRRKYWYPSASRVTYEEVNQWLNILYHKDHLSETNIRTLIYELAQDGLVQFQMDNSDYDSLFDPLGQRRGAVTIVRVHDLYSDLAHREAATSSRFFICGKSNKSMEQIEWEKLERVVLGPEENCAPFVKEVQQQECKTLQVLFAHVVVLRTGIDMRLMPSLCCLYLSHVKLGMIKNWSAASRLGSVFLSNVRGVGDIRVVSDIRGVVPHENDRPPAIEKRKLKEWKSLWLSQHISRAGPHHDHISGVGGHLLKSSSSMSVLSLDALIQLQALHVEECNDLERIHGLDSLKHLETLSLILCNCLESLDGLSALPRLKALRIAGCRKVKRLSDLSRLTCLEELVLDDNEHLEEMEGASPPALNSLQITKCPALKSTPDLSSSLTDLDIRECPVDLSGLMRLDKLRLENLMMEELGALSSSVREMHIAECYALKRVPDLSGLTCLAVLELRSNYGMEEVGCLTSTLQKISIAGCSKLKKMPDLSGLTRLNDLRVSCCYALQVMPDISGLKSLRSLHLLSNSLMEEVGGQYVSSTLEVLTLRRCKAMRSIPSLKDCVQLREVAVSDDAIALVTSSALPNMRKLNLYEGEWPFMSEQQWKLSFFTHLEDLTVCFCDASRMDLACLSPLVNLKSLKLSWMTGLKEIANSGKLKGLERLELLYCENVEKLDGFGERDFQTLGLRGRIEFQRCTSDDEAAHWSIIK